MPYGSGLYGNGLYGVGGGSGTPGTLISEPWSVEYRGVVWGGDSSDLGLSDLSGWFDKSIRGSRTDRPGRHGSIAGRGHAETRTVEVELTSRSDDIAVLNAVDDVIALTEEPVEEPLVIWAGTDAPLLVNGRLEKASIPTDHDWSVGHHRIRLQWVCSDPRRYGVDIYTSPVLGMPGGATTGITFPVTYPISFGGGVSTGSLLLPNTGNGAAYPVFTLTGPLSAPSITRADTSQRLQFDPAFVIGAGQTLTLDTGTRSVLLDGVSRRDALIVADWFTLPRNSNTVVLLGSTGGFDPAAGLSAAYRMPRI